MANPEIRKIAIDDVVESAATGVLRALDARAAAGGSPEKVGIRDLVASGFFVDFVIRCGGNPGPVDIIGGGTLPKGG